MTGVTLDHDWFPHPLPDNIEIGERTWIYSSFAFVHYASTRPVGLRLGNDCGVYVGTHFDLGPGAEVSLGDFSLFGGTTIATDHRITIGTHALISFGVVFADSYAAIPSRSSPWVDRMDERTDPDIELGDNVWVGARAMILGGSRIGSDAVIGATTVVEGEVPDGAIVAGNPARIVGWAGSREPRDSI